ncbi:flagellar hook-length control protein FliK [Burkholderia sp. MR1-5-21]
MPSLSLLGSLIDTAASALKGARKTDASDTSASNGATAAPLPFARTLKQTVATQRASAAANASDPSSVAPSRHAVAAAAMSKAADDTKSSDPSDDKTATVNPDAAALAAAAAVQAQLQARPDGTAATTDAANAAIAMATTSTTATTGTTATTATTDTPSADTLTHAGDAASAAGTNATGSPRDALHAALEKLTGGTNAVALPASGAATPQQTAATTAAPLAPKVPTFDKTLADAKGTLAANPAQAQTPTPAAPSLQAEAAAKADPAAGATHALAATQDVADPAHAALAAATAAAQPTLQTTPAAANVAAANANVLAPHVGTADWTDALSQKVVFLSNAHQQSAELTLNPPDLGPLQVVLRVADNHAHALFVSQHAQVRDAVEAALPKLRDAMEAGGLGLGSATVSDGGFASQQQNPQQTFAGGQAPRRGNAAPSGGDAPLDAAPSAAAGATVTRAGLVDTFA